MAISGEIEPEGDGGHNKSEQGLCKKKHGKKPTEEGVPYSVTGWNKGNRRIIFKNAGTENRRGKKFLEKDSHEEQHTKGSFQLKNVKTERRKVK